MRSTYCETGAKEISGHSSKQGLALFNSGIEMVSVSWPTTCNGMGQSQYLWTGPKDARAGLAGESGSRPTHTHQSAAKWETVLAKRLRVHLMAPFWEIELAIHGTGQGAFTVMTRSQHSLIDLTLPESRKHFCQKPFTVWRETEGTRSGVMKDHKIPKQSPKSLVLLSIAVC